MEAEGGQQVHISKYTYENAMLTDRVISVNFISSLNFYYHLTQIVIAFVNILVYRGYMLKIWTWEVGGEGGGTNGC